MTAYSNEPQTIEIAFRRPGLLESPLLVQLLSASVFAPIGYLAVVGTRGLPAIPVLAAFYLVLALLVVMWRIWWVRRDRDLPPIIVGPDELVLPPSADFRRIVHVPLTKIRSAVVLGRRGGGRLVIDAGRRQFAFPVRLFAAPDAVATLQGALRHNLAAQPDGAARAAAISARHDLATAVRHVRPYATWMVIAVLTGCFALQSHWQTSDPLSPLFLGANAPLLVRHGEWFRLATANLLHESPFHLLTNLGALLLYGTFVERLAGFRRTLLVVLASGVAAHAVSAAAGLLLERHLFSIGVSGAVFGLLGALGAIIWRFGARIPGGLRPPGPAWWVLLVGYAVIISAVAPQIDGAAHAGGALAGFALGALVCGTCPDTSALRRPGIGVTIATACFALGWVAAIGADVANIAGPGGRLADEAVLAAGTLDYPPPLQNGVAWDIAIDPDAGDALLHQAEELATRAVVTTTRLTPDEPALAAYSDTQAAVFYRLGDAGRAMRTEFPLFLKDWHFAAHFALFLDRNFRIGGLQLVGEAGAAAPTITLADGVLHLAMPDAAPNGARVYAILRTHDVVAGLLLLPIPPNFAGRTLVPIPWSFHGPRAEAPDPIWTDPDSTVVVALFDRRSCDCKTPQIGPWFYPAATADDLPPWHAAP